MRTFFFAICYLFKNCASIQLERSTKIYEPWKNIIKNAATDLSFGQGCFASTDQKRAVANDVDWKNTKKLYLGGG